MTIEQTFVKYAADKLEQYCSRIEICVDKLTPEQIWMRGTDHSNAIGNLVLHLNGNVRQWILHGVGGSQDDRQRDAEFAAREFDVDGLKLRLRSTVDEAAALIRSLPASRLSGEFSVQNYNVTVLEAIMHVVEHFSGHTAQIIFITKFVTGEDLGFYAHLKLPQSHAQKTP